MNVLVVTPTLGSSPWLTETVASVSALDVGCRHMLVCPAGVRTDLEKRFPQTQVVTEPGGGMYAAINAAVVAATEGWDAFTYINDDDVLLPRFAAVVRVTERAGGSEAVVFGRVRLIDSAGRRLGAIPISPAAALNRALYAGGIEPVYQHGTVLTRAAWTRLGGFDATLRYCGDSDLLARACLAGIPFVRVGGEVAAFRLRAAQLSKNHAAMAAERTKVWDKLRLSPLQGHLLARWIFRLANLPVYAERIARHGIVSMQELARHE